MKGKALRGFTLVELAIILIILGLVVTIGTGVMIQFIKWNKRKQTQDKLNLTTTILTEKAASNGTLNISDIPEIKDAYLQNVLLVLSNKLTAPYLSSKNATICDLKNTGLSFYDNATGSNLLNVAFVVFSRGDDYSSDTYCNGIKVNHPIICSGNVTTDSTKDLVKVVTLPQLKQSLQCPGIPLKILNQYLPTAIENSYYKASIYASGGIKPYTWSLTGKLPKGLTYSSNNYSLTIRGTPKINSAGSYAIKVCVQDTNTPLPYKYCKIFRLKVTSQTPSPPTPPNTCEHYSIKYTAESQSSHRIYSELLYTSPNDYISLFQSVPLNTYIGDYRPGTLKISFVNENETQTKTVIDDIAQNLDTDRDCTITIHCTVPSNYNGYNLNSINIKCSYK